MKIGIVTKGFDAWGGGVDFIRLVASCLELTDSENQYEKYILLAKNDGTFYINKAILPFRCLFAQIIRKKPLRWQTWKGFDEHYLRKTFSDFQSYQLDYPGSRFRDHFSFAQTKSMDVILPCFSPPPESYSFPWVGYIYDFQHKYLPEFFTEREMAERDNAFINMLNRADHIIVNSQAVKQDANKFIGDYKAQIHVLPFTPIPREEWLNDSRDLSKQYGISKPYFIICNQFWIHKDHVTAIKAYSKFLEKVGNSHQLVCTGNTSDHRFPDYFNNLLKLMDDTGTRDKIKILGHIPKLDQISLLKNSTAVIQPTLFEGGPGGGSAYDAVALGIPLIVSDIPVNLEIHRNDKVLFFKAKSSEDLASKMQQMASMRLDTANKNYLREKGLARQLACGRVLVDIIQQSTGQY